MGNKIINTGLKEFDNIQLYQGQTALDIVSDPKFVMQWNKVYDECPWSTVFQSSDFVGTWYHAFQKLYLPIIILANYDGEPVGIMTLALRLSDNLNDKPIVAAGHGESDSQTWLCSHERFNDEFITKSLTLILTQFPNNNILFRHIPPKVSLKWIREDSKWNSRCHIKTFKRPLIDLKQFQISKRNRKRLNRLKNIGVYENVQGPDFYNYLNELALQYDFRQGAMFNRTPYRKNQAYFCFLKGLYKKKLIKVSVFKNEKGIVAGLIVIVGKNIAHTGGINAYSPFYADYSPGYMQFVMMSHQLAQEKFEYFDLTPGADGYKERLANHYDLVNTLIVSGNRKFIIKKKFRSIVNSFMSRLGYVPFDLKFAIEKKIYLIQKKGWLKSIASILKIKHLNMVSQLLIKPSEVIQVEKNSLDALMNYRYKGFGLTEWEFLENSMKNIENGKEVFTYCKEGVLIISIWYDRNPMTDNFCLENMVLFQDLYCDAGETTILPSFLFEVVRGLGYHYKDENFYLLFDDTLHEKVKSEIFFGPERKVKMSNEAKSINFN